MIFYCDDGDGGDDGVKKCCYEIPRWWQNFQH